MNAPALPSAFDLLHQVGEAAASLEADEVPRFVGELERVKADALLHALSKAGSPAPAAIETAAPSSDRSLTAEEVGRIYGRSKWWVYDHASELPRVVLPGGRLGFSERAVLRDFEKRRAAGLNPTQELIRRRIRAGSRSRAKKAIA